MLRDQRPSRVRSSFRAPAICPWCAGDAADWAFVLRDGPCFWLSCDVCGLISVWTGISLTWPARGRVLEVPPPVVEQAIRASQHEHVIYSGQLSTARAALEAELDRVSNATQFVWMFTRFANDIQAQRNSEEPLIRDRAGLGYAAAQFDEVDRSARVTDKAVLEAAQADIREAEAKIDALRRDIAAAEDRMAEIARFVETYESYARRAVSVDAGVLPHV